MCGIVGYLSGLYHSLDDKTSVLKRMSLAISHRGPDDSGEWWDSESTVALAHRRLSILDLSPAGHQPMISPSGRYIITYNGEIYNHLELRKLLGPHEWRGHSDTETILVCIENWGIEETLKKCVGMFALALWDRDLKNLVLARDRIGEKPLYYGWQGKTFMFASELKALKRHPDFIGEIDREALSIYLRYGYINCPYSIYENIKKLKPGTFVTINKNNGSGYFPEPTQFWSLEDIINKSCIEKYQGTLENAANELETILFNSIKRQMLSDVPLGAFLSGGLDSSLMVSLMQKYSDKPIKTFTIGFNEKNYNEANFAKKIALHLGTEHTELYVTDSDAMSVIPNLPNIYDEPFGDSSAIPTFLVSSLARKNVAVAITGDGGDELFYGYTRYLSGEYQWRNIENTPTIVKKLISKFAYHLSSKSISSVSNLLFKSVYKREDFSIIEKLKILQRMLNCNNYQEFYNNQMTLWRDQLLLTNDKRKLSLTSNTDDHIDFRMHYSDYVMYTDIQSYLPGDILTKVDRAGMAVGIETRIPFLDHKIVEFALSLPLKYKVQNGKGKYILREILKKYLPSELVDRKKMGFGVPVDNWIRGQFRGFTEDLLSEDKLKSEGLFHYKPIRERLRQHLDYEHNWKDSLWNILMFQLWKDNN